MYEKVIHPIEPVFCESSKILILGSFPSQKSREQMFYYGHPKNRFWEVLALVLGENTPKTVSEKKALLLSNGIALWDVIASCEIIGSSDSSIKNVCPNDLSVILSKSNIRAVFTNGKAAYKYYEKYSPDSYMKAICLPSTSPANAAWSASKLFEEWKKINDYLSDKQKI